MSSPSLLIIGCGDIGLSLADELKNDGARIIGVRRDPAALPASIVPLAADVTDRESLKVLNEPTDSVVITLTPGEFSDERYRRIFIEGLSHVLDRINEWPNRPHVYFVSSTSVYHQHDGEIVDEKSTTMPRSFSGRRLLEAEALLAASGLPYTVVRFGGIYGPGRYRLIEQVLAGDGCAAQPPLYTNRIHRDDCAGFLVHLLRRQWQGESLETLYLGVDNAAATLFDVKQWLAGQLGCTLAQAAGEHRRNSKRCVNYRMRTSGYTLRYPTFREGYEHVLEGWRIETQSAK